MRRVQLPLCREIERSPHSETAASLWLLPEFLLRIRLSPLLDSLPDVRRVLHLPAYRPLRFLPGLKLRLEIVPFLLSDALRMFHLPGDLRRAAVLNGVKVVETLLRLPVKAHAPVKGALALPEKIRPVKTAFHVAAALLPGMVGLGA